MGTTHKKEKCNFQNKSSALKKKHKNRENAIIKKNRAIKRNVVHAHYLVGTTNKRHTKSFPRVSITGERNKKKRSAIKKKKKKKVVHVTSVPPNLWEKKQSSLDSKS